METNLERTSEALRNARDELAKSDADRASLRTELAEALADRASLRDELAKLRHALADAEASLAHMRDQNKELTAGRDLADAVKRIVTEEIDSRFSGDTFEDRMRPVVEDIARDMLENATVEIDSAWIRV